MTTHWLRVTVVAALVAAIPAARVEALSSAQTTTRADVGAPASAQPATPLAHAIDDALIRGSGAAVRAFYLARGAAPLWLSSDGGATDSARALIAWVGEAAMHALPADHYDTGGLRGRLDEVRTPPESARLELDLTRLFLTYARDLSSGLLDPRDVAPEIDVTPPRPEPGRLLERAAEATDMSAFLAGLAPSDPGYRRLVDLRRSLRDIVRDGGWGPAIAAGPTLRLGDRSPRVAQLRARLGALGDLPAIQQVAANEVMNDAAPASGDPMLLDASLESAVRRFQARHGLNTDGAVGPNTLAALNTSASARAEQVAVNLERMRWLNRDLGQRHVVINLAAFSMSFFENGARRFTTRAVVGKAGRFQTPEFNDELQYIVVNPIWNVPRSIATREILPELRQDPTYLEKNDMELLGADTPATQIDWSSVTRGSFPWRIRQRPGPENALGAVKFLFPNRYSIYMHDTPAKRLFRKDERDFSHGCVRLEDPIEFAHLLLSYQVSDPVELFDRLRTMPGERWVTLEQPIPVYVTYRTAWVADDGSSHFRADVYGRDAQVAAALRQAGISIVGG